MKIGIWRIRILGAVLLAGFVAVGFAAAGCDEKSGSEESDETPAEESEAEEESTPPDEVSNSASENAGKESAPELESGEGKSPDELGEGTERQRELLSEAKSHFMEDDLEAAEPLFEKVVESDEMSGPRVSAYIALGQIYLKTDRSDRAVELLESMPPPGEKVVEARLVVARALARKGDEEGAIEEYERITDLQPNYVFVYPVLGSLYVRTGEEKKAAETYLTYENRLETMARALEAPEETGVADRLNLLDFLSAVNDERAVEAVREALDDPDPRVRARAAEVAGTMKIVSAEDRLRERSEEDPSEGVRDAARSALEKLEGLDGAPSRESGFPESARPESGE